MFWSEQVLRQKKAVLRQKHSFWTDEVLTYILSYLSQSDIAAVSKVRDLSAKSMASCLTEVQGTYLERKWHWSWHWGRG